ncbi:Carbonic anhydrase [Monoraphidium neglectum]|uniref:carbonic anhydrase n=1 Tax=Monoraphidium neglectum TaxID=145388 RepID=A0A0D2KSN8_9CHLO|nr:Carbonic anhydrase [Monoraphidium neglectum]KIY98548.1 Carbonic anhydrase [Monoraphidium neglectum]|eukprot:XP_013897568.1 Carbonic anhydrase [Monoraphidium neglectum]
METPGPGNPALTTTLKYAPPKARESITCPTFIDPRQLLPRPGTAYIRYSGSLTTPGCNEGVEWYVMLETVPVTPEQVLAFGQYVSGGKSLAQNSRPVQPLNGRAFDLQYDCA